MIVKRIIFIILLFIVLMLIMFFYRNNTKNIDSPPLQKINNQERQVSSMQISSPVFNNNNPIPVKYTCDGENVSPPLEFSSIPERAQSLVLVIEDPDAPAKTWIHWLLYNIPAHTTRIEEGIVPEQALEGLNDFQQEAYGGPCPPSGVHHYHFKLYALDTKLDLESGAPLSNVTNEMEGHVLSQSEIVGTYQSQ